MHLTRTTWGSVTLGPTAGCQTRKDDYGSNREPLRRVPRRGPAAAAGPRAEPAPPRRRRHRARGTPAERTFSDFLIRRDRRQPSPVQAAGIDSPGLIASLAIVERVADLADETLR
ncbi:MAG: hypothetical protein OXG04_19005 [Acidobacteria bacterium]|nr:hypothetical protein [Acidobacteriota bacterium]